MSDKDLEIAELRRELTWLKGSETVRYYLRKDEKGAYVNDIMALDRGIRELHERARRAERAAQGYMADAVQYRRMCECLEMERREAEESAYPIYPTSCI